MANKNRRLGFNPKGVPLRENAYVAGGTIYPGDLVKQDNTGRVVVAAAGDACIGVAATYATVGLAITLWDHPQQLFIAVAAGGAEIAAQTDLGLNYNHTAATASTTYKVSRQVVDASSGATNSNLTLKLLAISTEIGEALGSNAQVVCQINNHQLSGGTGTLGV